MSHWGNIEFYSSFHSSSIFSAQITLIIKLSSQTSTPKYIESLLCRKWNDLFSYLSTICCSCHFFFLINSCVDPVHQVSPEISLAEVNCTIQTNYTNIWSKFICHGFELLSRMLDRISLGIVVLYFLIYLFISFVFIPVSFNLDLTDYWWY